MQLLMHDCRVLTHEAGLAPQALAALVDAAGRAGDGRVVRAPMWRLALLAVCVLADDFAPEYGCVHLIGVATKYGDYVAERDINVGVGKTGLNHRGPLLSGSLYNLLIITEYLI